MDLVVLRAAAPSVVVQNGHADAYLQQFGLQGLLHDQVLQDRSI